MNSIFRFLYITLAPILACVLTLAISTGTVLNLCRDPVQEKVIGAVEKHLKNHSPQKITIFHDDIFIATKEIAKGQKIDADSLANSSAFLSSYEPEKVECLLEQPVVGTTAKRAISAEQVISAEDLVLTKKQSNAVEIDKDVSNSNLPRFVQMILIGLFGLLAIVAIGALLVGRVWILIDAFRAHLLWGLGSLFVPFVATVFEVKFWKQVKKAFQLQVVAFAVIGFLAGFCVCAKVEERHLQSLLWATDTVFYSIHDIPANAIIKPGDIQARKVEYGTTVAEANELKRPDIVGHKANSLIPSGMLICKYDLKD